jgi:hypothetical protein
MLLLSKRCFCYRSRTRKNIRNKKEHHTYTRIRVVVSMHRKTSFVIHGGALIIDPVAITQERYFDPRQIFRIEINGEVSKVEEFSMSISTRFLGSKSLSSKSIETIATRNKFIETKASTNLVLLPSSLLSHCSSLMLLFECRHIVHCVFWVDLKKSGLVMPVMCATPFKGYSKTW